MSDDRAIYLIDLKDLFSNKLDIAARKMDAFDKKAGKIGGPGSGLSGFAGMITRNLGWATLIAGAAAGTKELSKLGAAFEQTRISYQVMVGSVKGGNQLLAQIKDFAEKTPYMFGDVSEAGKLLLNYGVSAHKVLPTLKMLGDVAAGNAEKLHLLTLAYSQIQATGRLMGQDLLQLVNSGFNPLKIISEKTGVSMKDLKKKMEDGAISARDVERAFKIATQAGGLFYQMTEKQSQTFGGRLSTFFDKLEAKATALGEVLNAAFGPVLDKVNKALDNLDKTDTQKKVDDYKKATQERGKILAMYQNLLEYNGSKSPFAQAAAKTLEQQLVEEFPQFAKSFVNGKAVGLSGSKIQSYLKGTQGLDRQSVLKSIDKDIQDKVYMIDNLQKLLAQKNGEMTQKEVLKAQESIQEFIDQQKELIKTRNELTKNTPGKGFLSSAFSNDGKFDFQKPGGAGKKGDKVDGEVRSGGIKNITINITQLVGEINFESLNNLSENQAVQIVEQALLTAVNDANLAVP